MAAPADVDLLRRAAVALCTHACGGDLGRRKDDPVYIEVTEGRDGPTPAARKRYSSCGDLAHWLLRRMGCEAPWINRKPNWRTGQNISLLAGCLFARKHGFDGAWKPRPGDILLIWNDPQGHDAHALVVLSEPSGGLVRTANYGAGGMSEALNPGANIAQSPLKWDGRCWRLGKTQRQVQRQLSWDDLSKLIEHTPDLTGAELTGEEIDALMS